MIRRKYSCERAFLLEEDNSVVYTVDSMNQRYTILLNIPRLLYGSMYIYMCGCGWVQQNTRVKTSGAHAVYGNRVSG